MTDFLHSFSFRWRVNMFTSCLASSTAMLDSYCSHISLSRCMLPCFYPAITKCPLLSSKHQPCYYRFYVTSAGKVRYDLHLNVNFRFKLGNRCETDSEGKTTRPFNTIWHRHWKIISFKFPISTVFWCSGDSENNYLFCLWHYKLTFKSCWSGHITVV